MQRFPLTRAAKDPANSSSAPEQDIASEASQAVPNSFADWLARPSQTIASETDPEQGVFVTLMNECPPHIVADSPSTVQARRK